MSTYYVDAAVGNDANLGTSPGAGNAWATLGKAASVAIAADTVWVKASGTYTTSVQLVFNSGNSVPNTQSLIVSGYTTTPGDGGMANVTTSATITGPLIAMSNGNVAILNLNINGNALAQGGISGGSRGCYISGCKVTNTTQYGIYIGGECFVRGCEVTALATGATRCFDGATGGIFTDCWAHDPGVASCHGFSFAGQNGKTTYNRCIASYCTGDGFNLGNALELTLVMNCIAYHNTGSGINNSGSVYDAMFVINCISVLNGGYGLARGYNQVISLPTMNFNAFYNNTSGPYSNVIAGVNDVSLSGDPFVSGSTGNFALNSTAGAGASCRAAGYPGLFPGGLTTGYRDIGPIQHQDAGVASLIFVRPPIVSGGLQIIE